MRRALLATTMLAQLTGAAMADGFGFGASQPWSLCQDAIRGAERSAPTAIPVNLLTAIARMESGRRDPETGRSTPWPWTINAEGQGFFFDSKAEAIAAVRDMRARGIRSIDVGCMQISMLYHPTAFGSLEEAFDPRSNAAYAARFLSQLHDQTGDWARATGMYHSATPELGAPYQQQVYALWSQEKQGDPSSMTRLASAWGSWPAKAANQWGGPVPPSQPGSNWTTSTAPMKLASGWGGPSLPAAGGSGAVALPFSRGDNARTIPLAQGAGTGSQGRGLDAYRAAPIAMAARTTRSLGG